MKPSSVGKMPERWLLPRSICSVNHDQTVIVQAKVQGEMSGFVRHLMRISAIHHVSLLHLYSRKLDRAVIIAGVRVPESKILLARLR